MNVASVPHVTDMRCTEAPGRDGTHDLETYEGREQYPETRCRWCLVSWARLDETARARRKRSNTKPGPRPGQFSKRGTRA